MPAAAMKDRAARGANARPWFDQKPIRQGEFLAPIDESLPL